MFFKTAKILALVCVCNTSYAETEEARARRLAREDIDYDKIQREELSKARELARKDLDYNAIQYQAEVDARTQARNQIDVMRLHRDEEALIRRQVSANIDRQMIFDQEWNKIFQNIMMNEFSPSQILQHERTIYNRELGGISDRVRQQAESDARRDVYPQAYQNYTHAVQEEVKHAFQRAEVYQPIQEQARAHEIARITKEEETKVRNEMADQIRRALRERCRKGELVVLDAAAKEAIEKETLQQVRKEETKKYHDECYAKTRNTLSDDEKRIIHSKAFEKIMGEHADRKTKYLKEQKDIYTAKVETWNRMIRWVNFFTFVPFLRYDEYSVSAEVDRMMYAYEHQLKSMN